MSLGKILGVTAILLFGTLGIAALLKDSAQSKDLPVAQLQEPAVLEVDLEEAVVPLESVQVALPQPEPEKQDVVTEQKELPDANRIHQLFNTKGEKLPIVETIVYKSRVAWLKGRPAWLSDYASHYETSRHFIARSLNGKPDYLKQDIAEGAKFNVLRTDIPLKFHLVVDASRCKMWFYAIDDSNHSAILLKTYSVGLGRADNKQASGLLTPLGKYSLGSRVAIYKPGTMGNHKGQKIEMVSVFGTRWIPFDKEIASTTAPAKGLGIHGVPWLKKADGSYAQDLKGLNDYYSDGCIRMDKEDVEELFAIIISKPTVVEIVKDFQQSEMAR